MTQTDQFICRIWQNDNHTFSIEWSDGAVQEFRLSHLQRCCPCAQCQEEIRGEHDHVADNVRDDVKAVSIRNVGRYGLRIQFTSGCSMGIFGFDQLRNFNHGGKC